MNDPAPSHGVSKTSQQRENLVGPGSGVWTCGATKKNMRKKEEQDMARKEYGHLVKPLRVQQTPPGLYAEPRVWMEGA